MMGAETFILLNAGLLGPKSANQAESGLAVLPAILWISRLEERSRLRRLKKYLSPISTGQGKFRRLTDFVI
jgi:hypothetical protein